VLGDVLLRRSQTYILGGAYNTFGPILTKSVNIFNTLSSFSFLSLFSQLFRAGHLCPKPPLVSTFYIYHTFTNSVAYFKGGVRFNTPESVSKESIICEKYILNFFNVDHFITILSENSSITFKTQTGVKKELHNNRF
jgi:hypothetical protein